ncbi:MAG: aminotransferase class I/II-fold pyridoxal phosphate-dependent enzyme [Bacteroidales bacterium]
MKQDYNTVSLKDFADFDNKDIMERSAIFQKYLEFLRKEKQLNYRIRSTHGSEPVARILDPNTGKEKEAISFISNDYLNLTKNPEVIEAGKQALLKYGSGAGASQLIGGNLDIHVELEKKIAAFNNMEDSIIYTSGFGANAGSILAMLQEKDVAIMDIFVHASVIDGTYKTNVKWFLHNDMASLEKALKDVQNKYRTKMIIVDGVYSQEADLAPLNKIVELARAYGAYVMVDDAHGQGVFGKNGKGTPEHFDLLGKIDVLTGTFSKSFGAVGGFLCASKELTDLLKYYARMNIFSAAPTPQVTGSLLRSIDIVEEQPEIREKLWWNINYLKQNLTALGFDIGNTESAIFPIIIGDDVKVRESARILLERGIYVNPILYPAVPRRVTRLRISLIATHEKEHLDALLNHLEDVAQKLNLPKKQYA